MLSLVKGWNSRVGQQLARAAGVGAGQSHGRELLLQSHAVNNPSRQ